MGQKSLENAIHEVYQKQSKEIKKISQEALFALRELIDEDNWLAAVLTQMHWSQSLNKWDGWLYARIIAKMQELEKNEKNWKPKEDDFIGLQYKYQTIYVGNIEIDNWAYPNESINENINLIERYSNLFDYKIFNDPQGEDGWLTLKKDIEMTNIGYILGLPYDKSKKRGIIKKGYKFVLEIGTVPLCKSENYLTNLRNDYFGYARIPYEIKDYDPMLILIAKENNEFV